MFENKSKLRFSGIKKGLINDGNYSMIQEVDSVYEQSTFNHLAYDTNSLYSSKQYYLLVFIYFIVMKIQHVKPATSKDESGKVNNKVELPPDALGTGKN